CGAVAEDVAGVGESRNRHGFHTQPDGRRCTRAVRERESDHAREYCGAQEAGPSHALHANECTFASGMETHQHPVELIMARGFTSNLETPAFLVDDAGNLIYFNESAGEL